MFGAYIDQAAQGGKRLRRRGLWVAAAGVALTALSYLGTAEPLILGIPGLTLGCALTGVGAGLFAVGARAK